MRDHRPLPRVSPEDVVGFVRQATIVTDTSVLTALYRLDTAAREQALAVLEMAHDRLWIPHHVATEFYRNVPAVRAELAEAYEDAAKTLRAAAEKAKQAFGPSTRWKESRRVAAQIIEDAVVAACTGLEESAAADPARVEADDDVVLARIEALFAGRVGAEPAPDTVRRLVAEFREWRVPNRLPPGYADRDKSTPLLAAGDYLVWAQLLDYASGVNEPVLFVTNDAKADWFADGRPRQELVAEFARHSDAGYHQMLLDDFLEAAGSAFGTAVAESTVDQVAEQRANDRVVPSAISRVLLRRLVADLARSGRLGASAEVLAAWESLSSRSEPWPDWPAQWSLPHADYVEGAVDGRLLEALRSAADAALAVAPEDEPPRQEAD